MKTITVLVNLLICTVALSASAQEAESSAIVTPRIATYNMDVMPKDPMASMAFSAFLPGIGQIYNKEYLRGAITGVAFWGSFFTVQYLAARWVTLNTDTFYVEEVNPVTGDGTSIYHPAYFPKSEDEQVGLPTGEKAFLGTAIVLGAASYVWGLFDSYQGARRYNAKLSAAKVSLSVEPVINPFALQTGIRAELRF